MAEQTGYEPFEVDQHIVAECRYYVGKIAGCFYDRLKNEKKITAVRCRSCDKVYWPPRANCGRCFDALSEENMVEIGPEGTLETFTRINYSEPVHPEGFTQVYGIIRMDGADTGIAHMIRAENYESLKTGMRMTPVFTEAPSGNILDIKYFEPV